MKKVAKNFKVLIAELGEVLFHEDLEVILDSIVENYEVPVEDLLDQVCIIEVTTLDGYVGGTLPLRTQVELINDYIKRKGA